MQIAIFLFEGITALDAIGPYASLARLPQVEIVFVGKKPGLVRAGDGFLALQADVGIADVTAADILLVPGGSQRHLVPLLSDAALHAWIRHIDSKSRWTSSVCSGSLVLAGAGLLKGRTAATHWRAKCALADFGVLYSPERVVVDGKYITSAGVSAGLDMGLLLCAEIAGREIAEAVQLSMQYDPQPPFDCGNAERDATPDRVRIVENKLRV
jgi:putative intracellular protease/amidase